MALTPQGYEGVVKEYGDIRLYIRPDGTLRPDWEHHYLAMCDLPGEIPLGWIPGKSVSRIRCNKSLVDRFRAAFDSIKAAGLWPELKTFDGCFAYRPQRGSSQKLSLHSWGAAIDLNAATNQMGTEGDMPPGIVQCFEAVGFVWGGRFQRPDPQHFQAASGM